MILDFIAAFRSLRRSPAFTVAVIVTLALAVGANTAMFSVVDAVLLRPLPGYDTDRIVLIQQIRRESRGYMAPDVFLRLRGMLGSFSMISANQNCRMNLTGVGEPEQAAGPCASANWFDLQRAGAMLGRTFLPDEDRRGRNHVAVLDHAFWLQRFGGDRGVIGRKLTLDGEPWTVVGVMPPGFRPAETDAGSIYTPYVVEDNPHAVNVTARLQPGVAVKAAQAELDAAARSLAAANPEWRGLTFKAEPALEWLTGPQRPLLFVLFGAVGCVLLIACVNVALLGSARSAARARDTDIRMALGAGRGRIARLVFVEMLTLAVPAGVAAIGLAYWGLRALAPLIQTLPRADGIAVDWRVAAWSAGACLAAAALSAALPALRPLGAGGSQPWLIAGQTAMAFVLTVGAGLMLESFATLRAKDFGYDSRGVLTSFLALPASADGSRAAGAAAYERIRERIGALPGVTGVATASSVPMFGVAISMDVHIEGEPERRREHVAAMAAVSDGYFRVMGIPLRAGRLFGPADREGSTHVAIVSASIAARYFAGNAVGRRIIVPELLYNIDGGKEIPTEIVGVAGNVCVKSAADCDAEHIYLPESQNVLRMENLLVRTAGDPKAMTGAVRRALFEAAPTVPLDDPKTLEERAGYLTDSPRRAAWLLGVFAGLALALAAAGVYGVAANSAARRSREIGIRMALGAEPRHIAGLVYRAVMRPTVIGLVAGAAGAAALTRLLGALLYGVGPRDPKTLASAGIVLVAVALASGAIPAWSAARTDPARVLRRN